MPRTRKITTEIPFVHRAIDYFGVALFDRKIQSTFTGKRPASLIEFHQIKFVDSIAIKRNTFFNRLDRLTSIFLINLLSRLDKKRLPVVIFLDKPTKIRENSTERDWNFSRQNEKNISFVSSSKSFHCFVWKKSYTFPFEWENFGS